MSIVKHLLSAKIMSIMTHDLIYTTAELLPPKKLYLLAKKSPPLRAGIYAILND